MEGGTAPERKVMVVADPTRESAAALQYALSHVVVENDQLILLHVENPNSWKSTITTFLRRPTPPSAAAVIASSEGSVGRGGASSEGSVGRGGASSEGSVGRGGGGGGGGGGVGGGDLDFLEEMKKACKLAQPKLRVQIEKVEMDGNNKASTIIIRSGVISVDLLIIGQRRSISAAILGSKRSGGSVKGTRAIDTAEYLIENSKCTCVGVQRKGQNAGYLLNTRTQRNFWLLA